MKQRRQITINGFGLIMVACLIFFLATSLTGQGTADTLTRQEYMEAVDAGNVTSAIVKQNKETPTGQLILLMKDNSHRQMYVSDVTAEQDFLMEKKYIYRDKRGKLLPYEDKNNGLFEVKECFNEKTKWRGTQTLVTPKGRETFRLLCVE